MKRVLFCAGILALAASCTQDEFESTPIQNAQQKGISFVGSLPSTPATKGDFDWNAGTSLYDFFWYAEQDRINVYGDNVKKGTGSTWDAIAANQYAVYKATQSKAEGQFTAVQDADILNFDFSGLGAGEEKISNFIALYPGDPSTGATGAQILKKLTTGEYLIKNLPDLSEQVQKEVGVAPTEYMFMLSKSTGTQEYGYQSVGERVNLSFNRPFTAIVFKTANSDAYAGDFGKLKSITAKMLGSKEDGSVGDASYINYATKANNAKVGMLYDPKTGEMRLVSHASDLSNIADASTAAYTASEVATTPEDELTSVTLKLGDSTPEGLTWKDGEPAFMTINSVERTKKEYMTFTYEFENIILEVTDMSTSNSWPVRENGFVGDVVLDINKFPYLLVNNSGNYTLIVNSGNFSDVISADGKNVLDNDGTTGPALSAVKKIVANVELTNAELGLLKGFTGLTSITLSENTSIPAETFTQTSLKIINFPKVTNIVAGAFKGVGLTEVALPAYNFADATVRGEILTAANLVTLDMSGVDDMTPNFPAEGITLTNFAKLTTITVKDGVKVGSDSFNGCKALTTVKGIVNIVGTNAFANTDAAPNTVLTEIHIANTDIPAGTFANCEALKDIYYNDTEEQVVPTSVGAEAFKGCEALVNMDLSKIDAESTVGESAFDGCVAFVGIDEGGKNVVRVGGKEIEAEAFNGCAAIQYIEFKNAVKVGNNVLAGTTNMDEIQFLNPVDFTALTNANALGSYTATDVILYVAQGQEGVVNKVLKVGEKLDTSITFKNITVK